MPAIPATAKTHVSRVMTKLHARDRAQLVAIAYETGVQDMAAACDLLVDLLDRVVDKQPDRLDGIGQSRDEFADGMKRSRQTILDFYAKTPDYRVVHENLDDMSQVTTGMTYQKGAWVLHMLRQRIGDDRFRDGIRAYYRRYKDANASTTDFRHAMEQVAGEDLAPPLREKRGLAEARRGLHDDDLPVTERIGLVQPVLGRLEQHVREVVAHARRQRLRESGDGGGCAQPLARTVRPHRARRRDSVRRSISHT